jgi:phage terminase large subunit-like protein
MSKGLDVARRIHDNLPSPSDPSRPFEPTGPQLDLLVALYAEDGGDPLVRRAAWQGSKGIGKSPLAAAIAIDELVTHPAPLVQIAALSEEQANSTIYSLVLSMLRANDRRAAHRLGIDEGYGRLRLTDRPGKLEAVTSAAGSHEGERTTFAVMDETHLWTRQNGGAGLARTIRRNVSKAGGRTLELSNAHEPGLGSVAEQTEADYLAGKPGILFMATRPSRPPQSADSDEQLLAALAEVYADAPWIDQGRILAEIRDPAVPWDEASRYYLNLPAATASILVDPRRWSALAGGAPIPDGARVAVGFDGSHSQDGTAIVLCTEDGHLSLELLIERSPSDPPEWMVPRQLVHDTLADLFARFEVARLLADPYHWQTELEGWARQYGESIVLSYPTSSVRRFGAAVDRFRVAVAEGSLSHDGDANLARHLANARLGRGAGAAADSGHALFTLEKAGPGRLIDAAVAAVLAFEAMAGAPVPEPQRETLFAWV